MSSATNYLELELLDHLVGNGSYTPPATLYLALATNATTPDVELGTFTECTGTDYARKSFTSSDWNTASGGSVTTSANLQFPTAGGDWGTITHVAIMDAATSGNALIIQALASSKVVETGDTFTVNAGQLTISMT